MEELAGRADVSVDTIRFYQKRRLLPPPQRRGRIAWYGPEHVERLAHIKDLQRRGFSLAVIRRIVTGELDRADEPLAAAVVGAAEDGSGPRRRKSSSLSTSWRRARVSRRRSSSPSSREGLLVPRRHEGDARFTTADVDIVAAGLRLLETGLPMPELLALARRHHEAHARRPRARSRCSTPTSASPSAPPTCPTTRAPTGSSRRSAVLLPSVTALVAHHFRRVLLEVAQEHLESVGDSAELEAANAEASRRLEVVWP